MLLFLTEDSGLIKYSEFASEHRDKIFGGKYQLFPAATDPARPRPSPFPKFCLPLSGFAWKISRPEESELHWPTVLDLWILKVNRADGARSGLMWER